jgi:hypothetical protein
VVKLTKFPTASNMEIAVIVQVPGSVNRANVWPTDPDSTRPPGSEIPTPEP